jgi:hypothetical protein
MKCMYGRVLARAKLWYCPPVFVLDRLQLCYSSFSMSGWFIALIIGLKTKIIFLSLQASLGFRQTVDLLLYFLIHAL